MSIFFLSHSPYNGINYSKLDKTQSTVTTKKTNLIICKYNKVHYINQYIPSPAANPRYNDEIYIDSKYRQVQTNGFSNILELQVTSKIPI